MQTTENLGLNLQGAEDFADIEKLNENFEKLDSEVGNKIDKNNPTGTGAFSMNRKAGTEVGDYSFAGGIDCEASGSFSHAEGYATRAVKRCAHAEGESTTAGGDYSHAEGNSTTAGGNYSHAEGFCTIASSNYSHAEGNFTKANANYSHAEGDSSKAKGVASHAEGSYTTASGDGAHAEGYANKNGKQGIIEASGYGSHVEGYAGVASNDDVFYIGKIQATGKGAHAEGYAKASYEYSPGIGYQGYEYTTLASGDGSHAEGCGTTASGTYSHAEGLSTTASGNDGAHAEGIYTKASGYVSHAEGCGTNSSGTYSHAQGLDTTASGLYSHAEGHLSDAIGTSAHAEGSCTTANGEYSHAEGSYTNAKANYSHAGGLGTEAYSEACFAFGKYNTVPARQITANDASFIVIGNGSSDSSKSNALRLDGLGCLRTAGTITASTTADYAEFFEWLDGNVDSEDRVGHFVTLDGNKIRIATDKDDYILGVISGEPFVLGNGDCDVWNGMYLRDKFRRRLLEPAPKTEFVLDENGNPTGEQKEVLDDEGNVVYEGERLVLNPEYDNTKPYISRAARPEWDAVGMLGVLPVIHDGTAKVNGYVTVNKDGIATACEKTHENAYRVIHVNADDVVEIIFR